MDGHLLIVDDDAAACEFLQFVLRKEGLDVATETTAKGAFARVPVEDFDAVLTDIHMDGMDGIELCRRIQESRPNLPVLVVTGQASVDAAVAALRAGAYDFITKPIDINLLTPAVTRAIRQGQLDREVKRLRRALSDTQRFGNLIGKSPPLLKVCDLINRVAETSASVLITGESGTGKELIAHAVHERSRGRTGPMVALNCAAVPANLIESELFGHVRGAFTGANVTRTGLFVEADQGTLFLDEISELPLEIQPKLLRALQQRTVRPVGGTKEMPFDARLITATNRDLEYEVEAGHFREDLLYRIDVVRIDVPPLRMRGRDVLLLAQAFIERFADQSGNSVRTLDPKAAERLLAYDWPGNVRELENCMERAVALCPTDRINLTDLPEKIREHRRSDQLVVDTDDGEAMPTLEELERRYISKVLHTSSGNKSAAAKVLGLDRRTLYRRLEKYGIAK